MFQHAYGRRITLGIVAVIASLLLSAAATAAPSYLQLHGGVTGVLPWNEEISTYGGGITYGRTLTSRLSGTVGLVAANDISAHLVAGAQLKLVQVGPLGLSLRGNASAGTGLHADIWMYRSVAGGAQIDLRTGGYTLTSWGEIGLKEESAWHYNEMNRQFYSAGITLAPSSYRSGLAVAVGASTEEATPWRDWSTVQNWSANLGYRLAL